MKDRLKRVWYFLRLVLPLLLRTRARPVLFVRPGAMGDIICTFPAALELKKRHPHSAVIYSCLPDFACLPAMAGLTTHVIAENVARISCWRFLFSAIYHFDYGDERADSASVQTIIAEFCRQHQVTTTEAHPQLQINPAVLSRVKSLLAGRGMDGRPMIVIHLGPSWPVREWPRDAWISLVQELKARGLGCIIQIGTGKHVQLGTVQDAALPDIVSWVDQLTLEESIALISQADLFMGIDSGLLHAAAAMRTPAIGIFGATSPQFRFSKDSSCSFVVSRVECQGCHHRTPRLHWMTGCPYDIRCMKTIPVEEVLQAVLSKLSGNQIVARK